METYTKPPTRPLNSPPTPARTFAKAIVGGRSERTLMGEEVRAVREALEDAPRAAVGA